MSTVTEVTPDLQAIEHLEPPEIAAFPAGGALCGPALKTVTPEDWLREQASWLSHLDSPWADWLVRQVHNLAADVRFTGAATPDEHDDRMASLEGRRSAKLMDAGERAGRIEAALAQGTASLARLAATLEAENEAFWPGALS